MEDDTVEELFDLRLVRLVCQWGCEENSLQMADRSVSNFSRCVDGLAGKNDEKWEPLRFPSYEKVRQSQEKPESVPTLSTCSLLKIDQRQELFVEHRNKIHGSLSAVDSRGAIGYK